MGYQLRSYWTALEKLNYKLSGNDNFEELFKKFLELADMKKEVYNHDVYYLLEKYKKENIDKDSLQEHSQGFKLYEFASFQVTSNDIIPTTAVILKKGDEVFKHSSVGDGPIDALSSAIKNIIGLDVELKEYKIHSISGGKEALGRVNIKLAYRDKIYSARAIDTDIIKASGLAFVNGINEIILEA